MEKYVLNKKQIMLLLDSIIVSTIAFLFVIYIKLIHNNKTIINSYIYLLRIIVIEAYNFMRCKNAKFI